MLFWMLFLSFVTAGCGPFQDVAPDVHSEKKMPDEGENLIVVGFSQLGSESLWRTANSESIQEALTRENGFFLEFSNARQKQENQIKAIRGFISQRVDYIMFSPVTESGWDTVLREAKDAGIPVILVDRKASLEDDSLYTAWVGSDMISEGEKAGIWLEDYLRRPGRGGNQHCRIAGDGRFLRTAGTYKRIPEHCEGTCELAYSETGTGGLYDGQRKRSHGNVSQKLHGYRRSHFPERRYDLRSLAGDGREGHYDRGGRGNYSHFL